MEKLESLSEVEFHFHCPCPSPTNAKPVTRYQLIHGKLREPSNRLTYNNNNNHNNSHGVQFHFGESFKLDHFKFRTRYEPMSIRNGNAASDFVNYYLISSHFHWLSS